MSDHTATRLPAMTMLIVLMVSVAGCALPPLKERPESMALPIEDTTDTRLGQAIAPALEEHGQESGVLPLADPYDAYAARILLAEGADASLDVQYYIWRYDTTGRLMLNALYRAAERGVRVRILVDDNGISGLDEALSALDGHGNIEVRLFNPFAVRSPKWFGYLTDFSRLNHRMHNKSFTADNQATIIGGRNIADEYFGAGQGAWFADLDVLAVGPVVDRMSRDFDRYWTSESAYPADLLLPEVDDDKLAEIIASARALEQSDEAARYAKALEGSNFLKDLLGGNLEFTWAPVSMVSDDPAKALGNTPKDELMSRQLAEALGEPTRSVSLVSPYFIPTDAGVALFRELENNGVEVRILTNSLVANDVAMVHAGYAKYRKPLLKAGVELFEMRRQKEQKSQERSLQRGLSGSSSSSLHAKTFAIDGDTLFVGSFNFDPRSTHLNTELGFIIESRKLAQKLETMFDEQVPQAAYKLELDEDNNLQWIERNDGEVIVHSHEPETGPLKRSMVFLFSLLPIEWML